MVANILQQTLIPYDGSQDSTKHPVLISPKDIVDSDNIVYTTYSTKKKRPGIKQAFDIRPPGNRKILGGVDYWRLGVQKVVVYDGKNIRAIDPSTGKEDNINGSTPIPVDESVTFVKFYGYLIIFFGGGNTPPQAWTGSGKLVDLSSSAPNGSWGVVFLNSLWIPDPDVPGRINKSNTNDPTDFITGDAGTLDLDINDGDPSGLTAGFPPFNGNLYVTKRFAVYKIKPNLVSGSIIYSIEKISSGDIGCIAHNAAISVENSIIFPSDRGFHVLNSSDKISGIDTNFLSVNIQPDWVNDTNFSRAKYMQAAYDTELNAYLIIFPRASRLYPSDVWGFSLVAKQWFPWKDFSHTSMFRYVDTINQRKRTMVGSSLGDIGYLDTSVNTDYGEHFNIYIRSGIINPAQKPDEEFTFETFGALFVPQISGKFTVTMKIDGQVANEIEFDMTSDEDGKLLGVDWTLAVDPLGGIPQVIFDKQNIEGLGTFYELIITHEPDSNASEEEGFELLGITTDVVPLKKGTGRKGA